MARYLINKGISRYENMKFDDKGRIIDFGISKEVYNKVVESGLPFMTSGCASKNREGACNSPFLNCTPYKHT